MYIKICRFYVAYWILVSCALPVHLLLYFMFSFDCTLYLSLQIRYSDITWHWAIYRQQYIKFFLHCNQNYNIFTPNTAVYHSKLLCLDCTYCTSDYTESTTGMICLKITFFHPKCQFVILESYQLQVHAVILLEICTGKSCVTVKWKHSTEQCREWHLYWKRLYKKFSPNLKM